MAHEKTFPTQMIFLEDRYVSMNGRLVEWVELISSFGEIKVDDFLSEDSLIFPDAGSLTPLCLATQPDRPDRDKCLLMKHKKAFLNANFLTSTLQLVSDAFFSCDPTLCLSCLNPSILIPPPKNKKGSAPTQASQGKWHMFTKILRS